MKRLALIGSKDFAKQIREFAEENEKYEVVGYFDDFDEKGALIDGLPILGKLREVESVYQQGAFDCVFLASGYNNFQFREFAYSSLKGKVPFATIIMDHVRMGKNVHLGEGIFIGCNSTIGDNSSIGDNVFIHGHSEIGHDNTIGSHTYISGRFNSAGFVNLGKRNFYGICVIISDHIDICDDVWIGLGCIVAQNIKESGKYMTKSKLYKIE